MPSRSTASVLQLFYVCYYFHKLHDPGFCAFGRAVLLSCWCAVFPRSARKNRTHMIVEYHAAAGRIRSKGGRPRKSCYRQDVRAGGSAASTSWKERIL